MARRCCFGKVFGVVEVQFGGSLVAWIVDGKLLEEGGMGRIWEHQEMVVLVGFGEMRRKRLAQVVFHNGKRLLWLELVWHVGLKVIDKAEKTTETLKAILRDLTMMGWWALASATLEIWEGFWVSCMCEWHKGLGWWLSYENLVIFQF